MRGATVHDLKNGSLKKLGFLDFLVQTCQRHEYRIFKEEEKMIQYILSRTIQAFDIHIYLGLIERK